MGCAVRSIYGPHICGDALDIVGSRIVTGSWRAQQQLEVWDYFEGNKVSGGVVLAVSLWGDFNCDLLSLDLRYSMACVVITTSLHALCCTVL